MIDTKLINTLLTCIILFGITACSSNKLEEKGFSVMAVPESEDVDGISNDSLILETRPSNVLLTGFSQYRVATIYKLNYRDDSTIFIGSNDYHGNYSELGTSKGNQWNYHLIPGLEAVYGYNLVNLSHYNTETKNRKNFFDQPVLIKTFYYPAFSQDTLNYNPIKRNYFMVSVYDEDTDKNGFVNTRDLRRFYYFDLNAENKNALIPMNYSVVKSEYDPANDMIFVFAQLDENGNGKADEREPTHIFWIDLKDPLLHGSQF